MSNDRYKMWPMGKEWILKSLPNFLFWTLISLVLIFLENFNLLKPIHSISESGARPLKLTLYHSKQQISDSFSFLGFWRRGEQKIKYLEERNLELLVEAQKARTLEAENRTLRAQLEAPLPSSWEFIVSQTLGRTHYLTVDKGEKEGIHLGQVAVVKNFLVGRVVKVGLHESQLELPIDPESKIPVQTTKTGARGLLIGQFGNGINLEKVTQGESLEPEDSVATTGEGGYPKGILLGKINWVEKKESEIFQKAGVEPFLNYDSLETVFLIKI